MKAAKNHFWLKLSAVLWLLAGASSLFAQSHDRGKPEFPPVRLPRQVRNEAAIKALGSNLPAIAAWYGKSTEEMAKLLRQDKDLWVSRTGRLVYACEMEVPAGAEEVEAADVSRDHIASFPLDQKLKLHSLPGSKRVLYLDFDGYTLSGTAGTRAITAAQQSLRRHLILTVHPVHSAQRNCRESRISGSAWPRITRLLMWMLRPRNLPPTRLPEAAAVT
jgi:hypothetical protein